MRTSKLKQDLINKISGITKIGKLEEIMQLLKFQADQSLYVTNEEVKLAIREARDQINKGNFITNETLKNEIQEMVKTLGNIDDRNLILNTA